MIKWLLILFTCTSCDAQEMVLGTLGGQGSGLDFTKTNVFVGDSYTFGVAASTTANRWTSLFNTAKGGTESNLGVNGTFMEQNSPCGGTALPYDITTIPDYNSLPAGSVLIISIGINDVGINTASFTPAGFKAAYQAAIDYWNGTKNFPITQMLISSIYHPIDWTVYTTIGCSVSVAATDTRWGLYNDVIDELVAENPGIHFVDGGAYMLANFNSSHYAMDGLHLNDLGMSDYANYLLSVL